MTKVTDPELVRREITLGEHNCIRWKQNVSECPEYGKQQQDQGLAHRGVLASHAQGLGFNAQNYE